MRRRTLTCSRMRTDPGGRRRGRRALPPRVRSALIVLDHELVAQDPLITVAVASQSPAAVARVVPRRVVVGGVSTESVRGDLSLQTIESVGVGRVDETEARTTQQGSEQLSVPRPLPELERCRPIG